MIKKNCWQVRNCGRYPGGPKVNELGVCPAATDVTRNGVNGGKNAGRHCWWVAGTYCEGKVQGTWASKLTSCAACDFFKRVKEEEGESFQI
jgi:hypothetical protein